MRAFRPKRFKAEADLESRDGASLSDEQRKRMKAAFTRRVMGFMLKWRRCANRSCRRQEQCLGPPFMCDGNGAPWTNKQYRRLRRDILRRPPRIERMPEKDMRKPTRGAA